MLLCRFKAVDDATFISSPPEAVNPERKEPAWEVISKALAVGAVPERMICRPLVDSSVVEAVSMAPRAALLVPMPNLPALSILSLSTPDVVKPKVLAAGRYSPLSRSLAKLYPGSLSVPSAPCTAETTISVVSTPAMVMAPLNLEVPTTEKVVDGLAVPMPTLPSEALTTKVEVATESPVFKVLVA